VPSGIPDFRTPETGLWSKVDPMEVAHIDVFDREPERFWSYYRPRFQALGDKEPNRAHEALAELERRGLIEGVITQNIDRLHRAAGSENVIEVHGSIETSSCRRCATVFELEQVEDLFDERGVAICTTCGGAVKPDVVLFGEMLAESTMARASDLAERADLMLCVGSSLAVHPVAGLPQLTLGRGGRLAIVTKGETPYDSDAELKLEGEVDEELAALLAALDLPKAVVFDNDGLLLDTESVWTRAEEDLFERRGLEFTPADKLELVGTSAEIAGVILERRLGEPGRAWELIEELNVLVVAELEHGVEAMIGARELLERLRERGTPIGLVSNSPLRFVRRSIEIAGFEDLFDVVLSAHEVAAPKPAPDPYLEACRRLGVEPGPSVVALEDSPTGVAAARAAGLTVIGIPSVEGVALEEAHHLADSLLDSVVARQLAF
jgi:NAD-dependent deacetylase